MKAFMRARRHFCVFAMMTIVSLCSHATWTSSVAQDRPYPNRPITLIVAFSPGGTMDRWARLVGEQMSKSLGQQIVVENRAGAGGNVGSRQAARSAPDGYTLLMTYVGTLVINPVMYSNMGFDPMKDLASIGSIATAPSLLAVNPKFPAKTLKEFIAYAKAHPGEVNYASPGIGTAIHVSTELLGDAAGIQLKHVPYKGGGAAVSDVIGGHVQATMPPIPSIISSVNSGLLRAIAVTSPKRSPLLPDVPTISEAALPGFTADTRFGLMAPAGTPPQIIARLNSALRGALESEAFQKRMIGDGLTPQPDSPEEYLKANAEDEILWGGIVRKLNLKAE